MSELKPNPFVHLNVKSHYSLLESTIRIQSYLAKVKEWGSSAAALTDRGNMFGAVDFYLAAKAEGIKPILGCEMFMVQGNRTDKPEKRSKRVGVGGGADEDHHRLFSLVLLAKDAQGYENLCQMISRAWSEGLFQGRPRADRELISQYSAGLVCLSGGLKSEVNYHFARGMPEKAEKAVAWLKETFKDDLFLELQENGLPEQSQVNGAVYDLSIRWGLPVVATAGAHMMDPSSYRSLEAMMCISSGRTLMAADGAEPPLTGFYLRSPEEMAAVFSHYAGAVANTALVAQRCNFSFKLKDNQGRQIYHLPRFNPKQWADEASEQPLHEGNAAPELVERARDANGEFIVESYLRIMAEEGLKRRFEEPQFKKLRQSLESESLWAEQEKVYWARLTEELDMIVKTGFSGYFLIVSDFILYAKSVGIPVGPGRGSGAGSLVAYALKITDIDPIPFNLLFERFINPERVSMPDFDIDFCQDRRGEVIDYVVKKYGKDRVSQIVTFGKLLARSVIKDAGRVLGMTFAEVDMITKLIPEELGITLESAFEKEARLGELASQNPTVAKLFEIARTLEGLNRNAGIHAAGIVITNDPLTTYGPLMVGKENEAVVQFDKDYAEKIGLVKFDFLGLKTLTVIDNAVKFVRNGPNPSFDLSHIDYDDKGVFELLSSGDTDGVFQLESSGMKDLCSRVMPGSLEDITSINALYRPGPLESGMVDDFINRKHGRTVIEYPLPQLEEVLKETYGVIVYQEQVMRIARVLAGYSLGEADILRRAMGKKKPEEMAKQKARFIEGCEKNNVPPDKADAIFELLSKFAAYGFNKSHSAAYAVLSFQTAYLKRYYPAQFMAALMATEINDTDKLSQYVADARARGIAVLPPDVNASAKSFSVVEGQIRFGLEAIKGVGGVAVDMIIAEREKAGPFQNFVDFVKRVSLRKVNKKVLESLIMAGAFDSIAEENRATLFESVEAVIKYAAGVQEQAELGQVSMFDDFKTTDVRFIEQTDVLFQKVNDWPESQKLASEKQLVGFYVSGHPLEKKRALVKDFLAGDISAAVEDFAQRKTSFKPKAKQLDEFGRPVWDRSARDYGKYDVVLAVLVGSVREITTKKGDRMAFAEVEDERSKIEAVVFPEPYSQLGAQLQKSLKECVPIIVRGQFDLNEESPKLLLRSVEEFESFGASRVQTVVLKLNPSAAGKTELMRLREILMKHRGHCEAILEFEGVVSGTPFYSKQILPKELSLLPTAELANQIKALFKDASVRFL
jgi:DNA polymerase-3 subunit alpha